MKNHTRAGPVRVQTAVCLAVALVALLTTPAHATKPSSANYILQQSTLNAAGDEGISLSYELDGSAGQEMTIGTSSSGHYIVQSGFWGFVGSGLVPVYLTAERNSIDVSHIDLDWSGNNAPYDVYQATDCTNVFGSFFDQTFDKFYDDITPPAVTLVCYNVLATAPGPSPPPPAP